MSGNLYILFNSFKFLLTLQELMIKFTGLTQTTNTALHNTNDDKIRRPSRNEKSKSFPNLQ